MGIADIIELGPPAGSAFSRADLVRLAVFGAPPPVASVLHPPPPGTPLTPDLLRWIIEIGPPVNGFATPELFRLASLEPWPGVDFETVPTPPVRAPSHLSGLRANVRHTITTDPAPADAIAWTAPAGSWLRIDGGTATLWTPALSVPADYALPPVTVATFAGWLSLFAGCTATVLDGADAPRNACALVEGYWAATGAVVMLPKGTDLLWHILRVVALQMDVLTSDTASALETVSVRDALGIWLDYTGSLYNAPRLNGEDDDRYGARQTGELFSPWCNNYAMELLIGRLTGVPLSLVDAPGYAGVFVAHVLGSLRNVTVDQLVALIDRYRAAGAVCAFIDADVTTGAPAFGVAPHSNPDGILNGDAVLNGVYIRLWTNPHLSLE